MSPRFQAAMMAGGDGGEAEKAYVLGIALVGRRRRLSRTGGGWLVEMAAGWGGVLVVSGLYLWWPRGQPSAGVLWPRWSTRGLGVL
ncbi:hypothetical protein B1218_23415, partial [Pseudomonas ogarae]